MANQEELFLPLTEVDFVRLLLADLHDDLAGKVARYRQLADLSAGMGSYGAMIPGGDVACSAWVEARSSFVQGNFVATVLLCQSLAEQMLASHLAMGLSAEALPDRVKFPKTLRRCVAEGVISARDAEDLRKLMELRNPLSHYRGAQDASSLERRALDSREPAREHLLRDATFAIELAGRLLSLPDFRIDRRSLPC